jgi:3-oxoadipate enol-lactonase
VLCCSGAYLPPREQWIERAAQVRADGVAQQADAAMQRWFTPEFVDRAPETVRRLRETLAAASAEGYAACCEALADFDIRSEFSAVRAPTLVIAGADDPVGTPERVRELRDAIPGARLVVVPDARHLAAVEHPQTVARALEEHLGAEPPA